MKIKELKKTVTVSWSPAEQYPMMLAAGSAAQQVDASFSSSSSLELYSLNLGDPSLDLELKGSIQTPHKFQKLVWSGAGVIVGGCDGGLLQFYNSEKLLNSASDSLIGSSTKHTGQVTALDINPYQKNLLASGASESEIFIWDLNNTSQPMAPGNRSQPYDHVQGLAWNQQVQHILGSTFATRCLVWDLRKNEPIMKISDSQSRTRWRALAWHPGVATQLCIASEDDAAPVVQLWDLRLAASPLVTMEGHQKGILSLSWQRQDPDLLLSAGKDGRLLCWNPNNTQPGGELVVELGAGARFAAEAGWAPRCPALLAACADQAVHVHALLAGAPPPSSAGNSSSFLESFGGAAQLQALPAVAPAAPAPAPPHPARPPRWLLRPSAARFAFGGKLVTFEKCPQEAGSQKLVQISQVVSDPEVVETAAELDSLLALTQSQEPAAADRLAEYCHQKGDEAEDQNERYLWFFLRANFLPTFRTEVLNLLGFKQDEIPSKFKGQPPAADAPPNLAGLSRGESTETEAELSTDTSTDLSDAQTLIERKLANLDIDPAVANVMVPSGEDSTSLICRALVCGNLEEAVELCLDANRVADALIIASLGSQELLYKAQRYHLSARAAEPVSLLAGSLLRGRWEALVRGAAAASWKAVLATLVTHCDSDHLAHYCELLGARLTEEGQKAAAALCYACAAHGGAVAAVPQARRAPLALLLRAAAHVRARPVTPGGQLDAALAQHAERLAAQGCLHSALAALQGVRVPVAERLARALSHDQHAQFTQHAQQQPAQVGRRTRTSSSQSQARAHAQPLPHADVTNAFTPSPRDPWGASSIPAGAPQPPRPGSVGPQSGGISSRSKYKVDPSVQASPLYNQYSFNNPIQSQPQYGYNSPVPDQYGHASVPGHNFTPINQPNANMGQMNQMPHMNPTPLNSMNPLNSAPMNPNLAPLNSMNPMNSAPLNPINPMNSNSINSMNPAINGSYYGNQPVEPAVAALPPKPVQPGWNDPPMMTSKPKPKQEHQTQAPITHPLFGVEPPQHVPLVPTTQYPGQTGQYAGQTGQYTGQTTQFPGQTGQFSGQGQFPGQTAQYPGQQGQFPGQMGQYPGQMQQFPEQQGQYPSSMQAAYPQQADSPAPPQAPAPAAPAPKAPLPAQYAPLQHAFDSLREQCHERAPNPQMKRKLEDVQKRLEILYDLLRENKLSEAAVGTLQECAGAAAGGDAGGALQAAAALAGGADFAAVASFLPGLKVLLLLAGQLR